jgi:hypothetical protein
VPVTRFRHHVFRPWVNDLDRLGPLWVVDLRLGGLRGLILSYSTYNATKLEDSPCRSDAKDEQVFLQMQFLDEGHVLARKTLIVTP